MYRDLLVHIKSHEEWSPHLDAAIALAKRANAQLTGLVTFQEVAIAKQLAHGPGGGFEIVRRLEAEAAATAAALKQRFEEKLAAAGVSGAFETGEGRASELLTLMGRFHDLVIIEQTDPRHDELNWSSAEEAALNTGRPTLIIPREGVRDVVGKRILLAWNGSREATRALHAAMAFITQSEGVVLLEGPLREGLPSVTRAPEADIGAYLKRHGVAVDEADRQVKDGSAGEMILAAAKARGCDLIVMGAFGRRGLSRLILGSATAEVFRHTTLPVLTAH